MTASTTGVRRPASALTPSTLALLALAAVAWVGVVAYERHFGNGTGTMGMAFGEFLPMWGVMMSAMMLPAVAPVATLYARSVRSDVGVRLALFVAGYLVVWTIVGLPAYLALRWVDHVAGHSDTTMRSIAAVTLLAAGAYQLTPLKTRCLRHCRSPLSQLLRYGNVRGRFRDVKVALHHAGYCLGCCWALMALFVAFGVMNVWAMIGLAALIVCEKLLPKPELVVRAAGVAFLALALLVVVSPAVAHEVVPSTAAMSSGTMTRMGS